MKVAKDISSRMKEMLLDNKIGVKSGFINVLNKDVNKLLNDYFQLNYDVRVDINQIENGDYLIEIKGVASKIKQFETTINQLRD